MLKCIQQIYFHQPVLHLIFLGRIMDISISIFLFCMIYSSTLYLYYTGSLFIPTVHPLLFCLFKTPLSMSPLCSDWLVSRSCPSADSWQLGRRCKQTKTVGLPILYSKWKLLKYICTCLNPNSIPNSKYVNV